ncbi:MAG: DNA-3-methyladenine glycosylase [Flavobacteriales bacterium]|nr:DNA-3-methyladenine glycosylase [Flavobacteriales bacterium]
MKLTTDYFIQDDVVKLSKDLLGKVLCTNIAGKYTSGIITETEAYAGITDKASHAYGGRRTARNEVMYHEGGKAYVYLCYGIHHLFNVVTNVEGVPHAILIRAIYPMDGVDTMLIRRKSKIFNNNLTVGPGKVSQALGIHVGLNGTSLMDHIIWIEDRGINFKKNDINISKRIGIDYAGEDALLPYRFYIKHTSIEKNVLI